MSLAADLSAAGSRVRPLARKALQVTTHNIKRDWQAGADISEGSAIVGPYENAITYDTRETLTQVVAEIGPETGRAGGTAGFLEEGGPGVLTPPLHAGRDALEANVEDFYRGLEIAAADAIE